MWKRLLSRKRKIHQSHKRKMMDTQVENINRGSNVWKEENISSTLHENIQNCKQIFQNCSDMKFREFTIGQKFRGAVLWLDGLVDDKIFNGDLMHSLLHETRLIRSDEIHEPDQAFSLIKDNLMSIGDIKVQCKITEIVDSVLIGDSVILLDGYSEALVVTTKGWEKREVAEPITEGVVRGPRQGFTENIRTNTALIRRIIKTPQLKMENHKLGKLTKTDVTLIYIQGLADGNIINEVRRRLKKIEIDAILESGYIEELIEDEPYSPFPQIAHTERPDKAAANLLEGRMIIITDGTPFALIIPSLFVQFIQSNEDYYERYPMAFAVRLVRYFFFIVALILPSSYVAVTTYHQEMLPTPLLISIAGAHEGVPFPAVVEAILMEITFEALREAGVRLPKPVGQAVSIVGALVIGEAAVKAGIVSPAMVIVVSVTAIASFTVPAFNIGISIRMLRFPMMFLAAVLGFYGISLGLLAVLIHLCSLRSFGVPYLMPIAPTQKSGLKDVIFRAPWWRMKKRPGLIIDHNLNRMDNTMPEPGQFKTTNEPSKE